jgi:hypothetical protein
MVEVQAGATVGVELTFDRELLDVAAFVLREMGPLVCQHRHRQAVVLRVHLLHQLDLVGD